MNRIKELRKRYSMSQADLALILSVTQRTLSRYEMGKREPSINMLIALANYFDVTIDYLVGRND